MLLALTIAIGVKWKLFKSKISALREFIDILDAALADDKISEEEFSRLFEAFKKLFKASVS